MLNLGSSIGILIVGRILQGLSAAVVWVVGFALLADSIDTGEVAQMMGHVFVGLSLGFLLGPLLGGVVFAEGGYNWVFGMAYILIGVDIAMRLLMVEKKIARRWIETDGQPPAIAMTTVAKAGVKKEVGIKGDEIKTLPDEEKDAIKQISRERPLPAADMSQLCERASKPESIPKKMKLPPVITLLKSRRLLTSLWATVVLGALMTQFDSVLPLHVRRAFNWTSTGAGKSLVRTWWKATDVYRSRLPATRHTVIRYWCIRMVGRSIRRSLVRNSRLCALCPFRDFASTRDAQYLRPESSLVRVASIHWIYHGSNHCADHGGDYACRCE
jgi:MFS family permease